MSKLKKYYFTFCLGDEEKRNCFAVVIAKDCKKAREIFVEKYGLKWAFQYDEEQWTKDGVSQEKRFNLELWDVLYVS